MKLLNKYMLFCALLMTIFPVVLSTLTGEITATDWVYRHELWIRQYINGDFSIALKYPPLFHFMMLPFVFIGFPMELFQVIFIVMATLSLLYMTGKLESEDTLLYASFFLASSIAFVEFASALMPQALDYVLFAFAVLFYYRDKPVYSAILCAMIFLMHVMGAFFVLILFLHSFFTKRFDKAVVFFVLGLMLIPFLLLWNVYSPIETDYTWDVQAQRNWEMQYTTPFYNFFFFSGFLTWAVFPYAMYRLKINKFKLTDSQLLYVIWIACFFLLALLEFGIWRAMSYQIVPLSLLTASLVSKNERQEKF